MSKSASLIVVMENARGLLKQAYNQITAETKLPAYLMEGAVLDLLAEVRNRKSLELLSDMSREAEDPPEIKEK